MSSPVKHVMHLLLFAGAVFSLTAHAALTDIANSPMASSGNTSVKPNVMFILDDSGSMAWEFLPDSVGNNSGMRCYRNAFYNGVYYNPDITYGLPVDATGLPYPNSSFTAASTDGFLGGGTVDLSRQFKTGNDSSGQTAYYYKYTGTSPATPVRGTCYADTSYTKVVIQAMPIATLTVSGSNNAIVNSITVNGVQIMSGATTSSSTNSTVASRIAAKIMLNGFSASISSTTVTIVGPSSAAGYALLPSTSGTVTLATTAFSTPTAADIAAGQNFANWYTYYRNRIRTMKSAAGLAFKNIDNKFRVGFTTITDTGVDSTKNTFLKIADFDSPQKTAWYSKLYITSTPGWTPLRGALSKVGRMYAGQLLTGADDPVQYSCQQNFTILSTDGYWNTDQETSSYGPYQITSNTPVGNQDGTAPRPMYDSYSNTLADVAMYYYQTDLRTPALGNCTGALGAGVDVCENNVPGSGADVNPQQHMTTFTLGLGADGTLAYADNYLAGGSADYNAIVNGTKNWPDPINNTGPERIDDLWHAAVDGRGVYYSAKNSSSLISGLSNALAGVTSRAGSSAAAATSNLQPVAGDNYLFVALYRTVFWDGDLQAKTIDPITGVISATPVWAAQPLLDGKVTASSDTRTLYTYDSTSLTKLKPFLWANLTSTEQGYFNNMCSPTALLSQCPTLSTANQTAASGANLVNFLRGQNGNEGTLYRSRAHVMGDMVGSQPVYVRKPPFEYVDANYAAFRDTVQASRSPIVYVAANDGMLHAFDGATGAENWAYTPPMVMSNLYRLADTTYSVNHRYYVDGSPTAADICPSAPVTTCAATDWKTILVGGLNAGGRGYYALDITNPSAPKALWNFTSTDDPDLGYSFDVPIVTKRKDGTWVVVVTSGYNNVSPGSGGGYLYVLNASTGALLEKIGTGVGSTTAPSGLGKVNVWINTTTDNTAARFYGGDLLGNLWRFTLDSNPPAPPTVSTAGTAFLLAQVGGINGAGVQPITTRPELTQVPYSGTNFNVVEFGTGRYLGLTDLSNIDQQTIYAIKDDLGATGLGQVRATGVLVQQTLSNFTNANGQQARTTSNNPVDWTTKAGWYIDLNPGNTSPGERVNVDVQLQLGSLTVASNVPSSNACNVGGYSFLYNIDFKSGIYLPSATLQTVGVRLASNAMVAGMNTIRLQSGKIMTIVTDTGGGITAQETPLATGGGGTLKRSSWRELVQ